MLISATQREEISKQAIAWASQYGQPEQDRMLRTDIQWRPHIFCPEASLAVHLLFYPNIDSAFLQEFRLAKQKIRNLRVAIVGPVQFVQTSSVLLSADDVEAEFVVLEDQNGSVVPLEYRDALTLVYKMRLNLAQETYRSLAGASLSKALSLAGQAKGRQLESLIAFLFSQIPGFEVLSTNYNTATEEIDVVLRNRRVGGIFAAYNEPVILVECKNRKNRASKDDYVSFATKIRNRRQSVSVGVFVSMAGYTRDFRLESLRDSKERLVIAKLDREHLTRWTEITGDTAATFIEQLIEAATLE
jgi:Holliday junction resolvase-like predicted endonuclease